MNFRAFLRHNGEVFRRWRKESRIGGLISGVYFKWDGRDYVSDDPMRPDDVTAIQHNRMVQLELSTVPVGHVTIVEQSKEPVPEEPTPAPAIIHTKPKVTVTLPHRPALKIR